MARESIQDRLQEMIGTHLLAAGPGFGPQTDLFAAGLDSMAIMQLLLLIEEEFGITIPVESVSRANFSTVASVANLVMERKGEIPPEKAAEAGLSADFPPQLREKPSTPSASEPFSPEDGPEPSFPLPLLPMDHFVLALDRWMRKRGEGGHEAHTVVDLERLPDPEAMRGALREMVKRHPIITARLRRRWGWVGGWRWYPATDVTEIPLRLFAETGAEAFPHEIDVEQVTTVHQTTETLANQPLPEPSESAWAKVSLALIAKSDGSARLVFSWSHLILDGGSAQLFLAELQRLYSAKGEPFRGLQALPRETRPYGRRWQNTLPINAKLYDLQKIPFSSLGSGRKAGALRFRSLTLSAKATRQVTSRCESLCGPLVTLPFYLACAMRAHEAVFAHRLPMEQQPQAQVANVLTQTRRKGARGPIFRNHLSAFFARVTKAELVSLEKAVQALIQQHREWLEQRLGESFDDLLALMQPMPPAPYMQFIQRQMKGQFTSFFHSHTGEFASELPEFFGSPIQTAFHVPGFCTPPGTGLFCNECHSRLVITQCWKEGVMTEEEAILLFDNFVAELGAKTHETLTAA